ncbi:NAD-dependent histone deacetylase Hst3p [Trichomonascus vanleenenianus]|uniref:NAD-dependent histone deacetylase Hst3p n=1 Tax=Trichomonascus vanleenenianus TaxID=2268995 RepID=UPI003EC98694
MVETLPLHSKDEEVQTKLREIALRVQKSRKTVVITGAGISCGAGIPDFRSDNGLYNLVKHKYPKTVVKGKDLFDTVLFSNPNTISVFFTFMASLRKQILLAAPTDTHRFISRLKAKGKLLRCYTQNIDRLEEKLEADKALSLGVNPKLKPDVVQLHGDIDRLKCMSCAYECDWTVEHEEECDSGTPPDCPSCFESQQERLQKGKRATGVGSLRPNIVLYGEEHPDGELIGKCTSSDLRANPDCLIILGTSLKVVGIRKLVRTMAKAVKARNGVVVFVNATEVSRAMWKDVMDYHVQGDCNEWVNSLRSHIPAFFQDQARLAFATKKKSAGKSTMPSPPSTPQKKKKSKAESSEPSSSDLQIEYTPLTPPRNASREPTIEDSPTMRAPFKDMTNFDFDATTTNDDEKCVVAKRKLAIDDTLSNKRPCVHV